MIEKNVNSIYRHTVFVMLRKNTTLYQFPRCWIKDFVELFRHVMYLFQDCCYMLLYKEVTLSRISHISWVRLLYLDQLNVYIGRSIIDTSCLLLDNVR